MLEIRDLVVTLGDTRIEIPEMRVERGDYFIIMGTTGAGKTVLIETIAGFHRPDRGEIILEGKRINDLPPNRRGVAVVYQDSMLFPHLSVWENITYPLRFREMDENYAREIADLLGISSLLNRNPRTLSGGEMQRVAIARALAMKPEIILMDEPFGSLDRRTKERVRGIVKRTVKSLGATVVHITHDIETAWVMGNKVGIMHSGKLLQYGDIEEIFSRPSVGFVADFLDTNVLRGKVIGKEESLAVVQVGKERMYVAEDVEGDVYLSLRPENIIVSKQEIRSSMRNRLSGIVERMERRGNIVRILIRMDGFSLTSVLTPNAVHALDIREGDRVMVYFKASGVRVIG